LGFITQQFKALARIVNQVAWGQHSRPCKENDRSGGVPFLYRSLIAVASGALVSPAQQNAVAPRESSLSISVGEWNQENIHLLFPTPYFRRRQPMAVSQSISRDPSPGIIAAKCGYLLCMVPAIGG